MKGFTDATKVFHEAVEGAKRKMVEEIAKLMTGEKCAPCGRRYLDWGAAQAISDFTDSEVSKNTVDAIVGRAMEAFSDPGGWPLLGRSRDALYKARGWH